MEILSDALSCRWGAFVNYLAAALAGGVALYVVTFLAVPIGAILRVRNAIQTDTAIDRFFDIKTDGIFRDSRNIIHVSEQPSIMGQQYRWILSKKGFIQLFSVGAVFFVLAGMVSGTVCDIPYTKTAPDTTSSASVVGNSDVNQTSSSQAMPDVDVNTNQQPVRAVVIPKKINVREHANTDAAVVSTVERGFTVTIDGTNASKSWFHVSIDGIQGWIRADLLSIQNGDVSSLPVSSFE